MNAPIPPQAITLPAGALAGHQARSFAREISNEDYHAQHSYISHSGMAKLLRSPAHYHEYLNPKDTDDAAPNIGTAVHAAILEPAHFKNDYLVYPKRRQGKEWDQFVADHPGATILNETEYRRISGIIEAVQSFQDFPLAKSLAESQKELSLFWTDPETGIQCRARPDAFKFAIHDLKTIDDARPDSALRQIMRMDYDLQAAMYTEAVRQYTGEHLPFNLIFIELNAPHGIWVYPAGPTLIQSGMEKFRRGLAAFKAYAEHFKPGGQVYPNAISVLEAPRWRQRELGYAGTRSMPTSVQGDEDDLGYF